MAENRWYISPVLNQWIDPVLHPDGIQSSVAPQYLSFASNAVSVNEDGLTAVVFTVNTSGVADGTTVGYTITGISVDDISLSSLTGSITISGNTGTVQFTAVADQTTEGSETMVVTLDATDSNGTSTGETAPSVSVIINDTSLDPITTLVPSATTMNEGDTITFTFTTNQYPDGTYYWGKGAPGQTIETGDLSPDAPYYNYTPNSFTVSGGVGTFDVTAAEDYLTDGTESFRLCVSDGINYDYSQILAQSGYVTIYDTSFADSLSSASTVNEGDTITFTFTTSRPDGTYYFGTRPTDTAEPEDTLPQFDFAYQFYDSFTVTNGVGTFDIQAVADQTTEGNETLFVAVSTIGGYDSTGMVAWKLITIVDTSVTPPTVTLPSSYSISSTAPTVGTVSLTLHADGTTSIDSTDNPTGVGQDWLSTSGTVYSGVYEYYITRSSPSANFNYSGATLDAWTEITGDVVLSLTGPQNNATNANETLSVQIRQKTNTSNAGSTAAIFSYSVGEIQ